MRLRKCANCGKSFSAVGKAVRLCPECAAASKRDVIRERVCRQCGAVFDGGPRAWYCPSCRLERKRRKDVERKRKGPARKIGSIDVCAVCGKEYTVNSGRQRYCPACAENAIKNIDRAASREYFAQHKEEHYEARKDAIKLCVICGKPVPKGTPSVTCSEECATLVRKRHNQNADFKRGKSNSPSKIIRLDIAPRKE